MKQGVVWVTLAALLCGGCLNEVQNLSQVDNSGGSSPGSGGEGGVAGGSGGVNPTGGVSGGTSNPTGGQGGIGGGDGDGVHFVRFGHQNGQETVGDFCVAYTTDTNGFPLWGSEGVLAEHGYVASDHDGMKELTAYIPLDGEPVAFGYVYPGSSCASAAFQQAAAPPDQTHYTVIAMPYSFEPIVLWVVGDPVAENDAENAPAGFRVVNANFNSNPLEVYSQVSDLGPQFLGEFEFANSPTQYIDVGQDHLWKLLANEPNDPQTTTFDFVQLDLLPIRPRRTIYLSGMFPDQTWALACADTAAPSEFDPKRSPCFVINGSQP
ncbi:MAG: hypothetical protein IPK82_26315 [Polyangiaceae bacterium]|nr:hypothetical protein [Polyangiaceae bacterium]